MREATIGTVLLTALLLAAASPSSAKESFKDDAGRLIYTIDDDGIVSMFENSPTDLTLSVTRGTRAEMKPQITEINPEAVPAGAPTVLRLKGRNLIGATVKMSVPGIEVGAYAGKPKALDLPIRVPATVAPGEVTIEITTPIGTTTVVFWVKDLQIGGASPSKRDGAAQKLETSAPKSCPEGMVGVAAERGGFCIEIDRSFSGNVQKAEKTCAAAGKRLCTSSEWRTACEEAAAGKLQIRNMNGAWEWTGTQVIKALPGDSADYGAAGELNAVLLGQADCTTNRDFPTWRQESIPGRCCK